MPALEASDVSMRRCGRSLVQRVSLTAERGELLALCGPEGSGTRTLLHLLSGHLLPDVGRVRVDGRERGPRRCPASPDPRALASGPAESTALLAAPGAASILLLERPTAGSSEAEAHALLAAARRRADAGAAVVLAVDAPEPVAAYATTVALFVAGRLLSWGSADGRARAGRAHPQRSPRGGCRSGRLHHDLVHVAPQPVLVRLERLDQRVVVGMEVLGRVLVLRLVATPHVAAREAEPEVHPGVAGA